MTISRKIPYDFHIHTVWSHCASRDNTVANLIEEAALLNLDTIAFTDHYFQDIFQGWVLYENRNQVMIEATRQSLTEVQSDKVNVLVGCEADCLGVGKFTISEEVAKTLDMVSLSPTHFHTLRREEQNLMSDQKKANMIVEWTLPALHLPWVHIMPHPLWVPVHGLGNHELFIDLMNEKDLIEMGELSIKNKIAMEINLNSLSYEDYQRPMRRVIELWREMGVMFSRGSDAHSLDALDKDNIEDDVLVSYDLEPQHFITPEWFKN